MAGPLEMSVLWIQLGYTMKYSLSPREGPQALPSGFPSGSGYTSLYIPPILTIQIQYIIVKSGILEINSFNIALWAKCISQYTESSIHSREYTVKYSP